MLAVRASCRVSINPPSLYMYFMVFFFFFDRCTTSSLPPEPSTASASGNPDQASSTRLASFLMMLQAVALSLTLVGLPAGGLAPVVLSWSGTATFVVDYGEDFGHIP